MTESAAVPPASTSTGGGYGDLLLPAGSRRAKAVGAAFICLLLSGCHRDTEALDRLSRAYTAFLDRYFEVEVASFVPLVRGSPHNLYWNQLKLALDTTATNSARAHAAVECLNTYDMLVSPMMDDFQRKEQKLDKSVSELIESANAIRNSKWRSEALALAKAAREADEHFSTMHELVTKRFSLQTKIMNELVSNGGNIVAVLTSKLNATEKSELEQYGIKMEELRTSLKKAKQTVRDTFSALKGKTGLTEYPTKDSVEAPESPQE